LKVKKDTVFDVWEISLTGFRPQWVTDAFDNSQICWAHLPDGQEKFLLVGKPFAGPTAMFSMNIGPIGYYLLFDGRNLECVSKRKLEKYQKGNKS
jgi:hypothetical protein